MDIKTALPDGVSAGIELDDHRPERLSRALNPLDV
jgi:hypothetical protein